MSRLSTYLCTNIQLRAYLNFKIAIFIIRHELGTYSITHLTDQHCYFRCLIKFGGSKLNFYSIVEILQDLTRMT